MVIQVWPVSWVTSTSTKMGGLVPVVEKVASNAMHQPRDSCLQQRNYPNTVAQINQIFSTPRILPKLRKMIIRWPYKSLIIRPVIWPEDLLLRPPFSVLKPLLSVVV